MDASTLTKVLLITIIYVITVGLSGGIVRHIFKKINRHSDNGKSEIEGLATANMIIGKCENLIIISCVLANQITGIALIFAAKSLVRKQHR